MTYALGRLWDTAIGLTSGFLINTLILPYNNSNKIRSTVESLDREVIRFLEAMFDGGDQLPDPEEMTHIIDRMDQQLEIFSNQKLVLHLRRQRLDLKAYQRCEGKARELVAQMISLYHMGRPGRLNEESRRRLKASGAEIRDQRPLDSVMELDVVTNYHVGQILSLRRELLKALGKGKKKC